MVGEEYRTRHTEDREDHTGDDELLRDVTNDVMRSLASELWSKNGQDEDCDVLLDRMWEEFEEKRGLDPEQKPGWISQVENHVKHEMEYHFDPVHDWLNPGVQLLQEAKYEAILQAALELWNDNGREENLDALMDRMQKEFEEKRGLDPEQKPAWMSQVETALRESRGR